MSEGILSETRRIRKQNQLKKFMQQEYGMGITNQEAYDMGVIDDGMVAVALQPPAPPEPVREPTPEEAEKLRNLMERKGRRPGYEQETTE